HQLFDLCDSVVDTDIHDDFPDYFRRRVRVTGKAVVDAWRRVRIGAALSASRSTSLTRQSRVTGGFPLFRSLSGGVKRNGLVYRPYVGPSGRLPIQHLRRIHDGAMTANWKLVLVEVKIDVVVRLRIEVADVVHANALRRKFFVLFVCYLAHLLLAAAMVAH